MFSKSNKPLLYDCLQVSLINDSLVALGNKNTSDTELCSPVLTGSAKILNAKRGFCIFPCISLGRIGSRVSLMHM